MKFGILEFVCFFLSLDFGVWSFEFGILDLGTVGTSQKMKRMCQPQQCGPRRNAQYHRNVVGKILFIFGLGKFGRGGGDEDKPKNEKIVPATAIWTAP